MKKIFRVAATLLAVMLTGNAVAQETDNNRLNVNCMKKKILFVVTSHDKLGNTGQSTGYVLAEVAHPWKVLHDAGYEIDFVSPKGGLAPVDELNLNDPINKEFWENKTVHEKISNTMKPENVVPAEYHAIFYAGGHGVMWDFPDNTVLASIARSIYESGGVVAAVCHGPASLVNIKLSNGKYLVNDKKINSFTNEEEKAVKREHIVPFLLETKLKERGAKFENSAMWQVHVINDSRVITGQNPQSATSVGEAIKVQLESLFK